MNKLFIVVFLIVSTSILAFADDWKSFGNGVELKEQTKISAILDVPDKYVGKRVLVEGRIVDVCKKRGCWMEIASDKEFQTIIVKVEDGEIVFPMEAKGHLSLVEGMVEKLEISKEQRIKKLKHHAEEHGEEFDPASVTEGETIYRIRGLGAKVNYSK